MGFNKKDRDRGDAQASGPYPYPEGLSSFLGCSHGHQGAPGLDSNHSKVLASDCRRLCR